MSSGVVRVMYRMIKTFFPAYSFQYMLQVNVSLQFMLAGLIFSFSLTRKKRFPLYLGASLALCALYLLLNVIFRARYNTLFTRFIMRFIQLGMPLTIHLICFENPLSAKLKTWCAGVAAMEIGAAAYSFLLALLGIDERTTIALLHPSGNVSPLDWVLYFLLHILVYWIVWKVAGPKRGEELDGESRLSTMALTLACVLFLTVPDCISNEFKAGSWPLLMVNRLYLLVVSAFILVLCNGIELQSHYRTEMRVMEQVMAQERKQYHLLKENIDVINMRCHDLKHHLDDYADKLTQADIESLREAMDIYDRNIRTGSEVLDTVLYLSQLSCEKFGIELTCLADGRALGFMSGSHIYSLFMNAIGNAMEAAQKLENREKRVVSVSVGARGGELEIEVTNFFDGRLSGKGPLPETTKSNRGQHGFGTMSMRYIAQRYGGALSIRTQGDIYSLQIRIPIPDDA